jgi:hypothetical protein
MKEFTTTHKNLRIVGQTDEMRARGCGYYYAITCGSFSHTAFDTEAGLNRWAADRGLTVPAGALDNRGVFGVFPIAESYRTSNVVTDDPADVEQSADGFFTRAMSNGAYVVANIVTDPDGIRRVRTLNPNVRTRQTFDYAESRLMMGGHNTAKAA